MRIPYVNLVAQNTEIKAQLLSAMADVLDHGQFVLGPEVERFERAFAERCGVRYAVGVNSGTDALILALRVLGIGPGDEVITVPNSFVASTSCIALVGARPVFVDVRDDHNMDPARLEAAISPRSKTILPVHLTGRPADMDPIVAIARGRGLFVIEDAAQSVTAEYRGKPVGSMGDIGCFSMHPLKTLNACGDAGMVTTNNPALYEKLLLLRNIGLRSRDDCVVWSGNSRLDTLQAAILLVKLQYLDRWTERRRENAAFYRKALGKIGAVTLPVDKPAERAVYHTFVIQAEQRDELQEYLAANGVGTAIHYPVPIHLHKAAKHLGYGPDSFPVAERQARRILSLPIYPELTRSELEYIVATIEQFYSSTRAPTPLDPARAL